jgi:hypothetical protein
MTQFESRSFTSFRMTTPLKCHSDYYESGEGRNGCD